MRDPGKVRCYVFSRSQWVEWRKTEKSWSQLVRFWWNPVPKCSQLWKNAWSSRSVDSSFDEILIQCVVNKTLRLPRSCYRCNSGSEHRVGHHVKCDRGESHAEIYEGNFRGKYAKQDYCLWKRPGPTIWTFCWTKFQHTTLYETGNQPIMAM